MDCVQLSGEVAAAAVEGVDPHPFSIGQEFVGVADELGGDDVVEIADRSGDGIDVAGGDGAGCERLLELRERRAHLFALLAGARFLA